MERRENPEWGGLRNTLHVYYVSIVIVGQLNVQINDFIRTYMDMRHAEPIVLLSRRIGHDSFQMKASEPIVNRTNRMQRVMFAPYPPNPSSGLLQIFT